ncbi:hypothetical protein MRX96_012946 [Rhipicephalus microplus]
MRFTLNPVALSNHIVRMGDPRTRDYPLVTNPLFVFPMVAFYLYFVKVAGPRWMKDKKPFGRRQPRPCVQPVHGGNVDQGITGYMDDEMRAYYKQGWVFTAVRYADLLDTVFFVLRKKFTHISHLHVIHHTLVTINVWFYTLFAPEGQPALGLALNVAVHVVMYSYYFLTTLGPKVRKYLWWKKYLTAVQIVQFVIMIIHFSIPLTIRVVTPPRRESLAPEPMHDKSASACKAE